MAFSSCLRRLILLLFELADALDGALLAVPTFLEGGGFPAQPLQLVFDRAETLVRGVVVFLAEGLTLDFQVRNAAVEIVDFNGHGADLQAQGGAGLVDQVDGLVGQEAVGDVAAAKARRRR